MLNLFALYSLGILVKDYDCYCTKGGFANCFLERNIDSFP